MSENKNKCNHDHLEDNNLKDQAYKEINEIYKNSNFIELGDLKDINKINIDYNLPNFWLFKVIGDNNENFKNSISKFLEDKKLKNDISIIYSKNSKYCSFNFEIYVNNKEELFLYYKELKQIKETKFCF